MVVAVVVGRFALRFRLKLVRSLEKSLLVLLLLLAVAYLAGPVHLVRLDIAFPAAGIGQP